ncbi:MAG TPA: hypothetical protein GX404_02320 [Syntrophomonadaceae bacterium]|nr:hypothetical protein [Syntrophomonadaceae bacterium]
MKKDHSIFFVFILAAAVITGSTFGMLHNLPSLLKARQPVAVQKTSLQATSLRNDTPKQVADSSVANKKTSAQDDSADLLLTPEEKQEIQIMLDKLDPENSGNYSRQITLIQKKYRLSITGVLDRETLSKIVEETRLQKAEQTLQNSNEKG